MCVQNFDDSLNSAIRITYRISLRSSSLREPRYPLLKVVFGLIGVSNRRVRVNGRLCFVGSTCAPQRRTVGLGKGEYANMGICTGTTARTSGHDGALGGWGLRFTEWVDHRSDRCGNDPSAGSPTETLLRLHLPLSDKVWTSSR